jgi:hypothetical protein
MASKEEKHVGVWQSTTNGKERVAAIFFPEKVEKLEVRRTATNVNLILPSEILLRCGTKSTWRPMLTELRATLSLNYPSVGIMEVGVARDENYYIAGAAEKPYDADFIWRDALAGLIFIEKHRGDSPPVFQIELKGELCYVVKCQEWWPEEPGRFRMGDTSADVRTQPFQRISESVEVSYPSDVWASMIREAFEASLDNPLLALQPLLPFLTGGNK